MSLTSHTKVNKISIVNLVDLGGILLTYLQFLNFFLKSNISLSRRAVSLMHQPHAPADRPYKRYKFRTKQNLFGVPISHKGG